MGADIIVRADRNLYTLLDFKYNRHFFGSGGGHGSGKNKKGKDAPDVVIKVPLGTALKDLKTGCVLRDLNEDGEEVVAACGGKGGLGNKHGRLVTDGEPGEAKELLLDLRLIADVGVVGFPNAGKSTLVSNISNAHPKVAGYPFTTKSPVLGVVRQEAKTFVVADIPGLIEGSSCGRGLGDKFLRHIERTRIILHLIDMSGQEARDPEEDFKIINNELKNYSPELLKKQQVIVANKMDLPGAKANLERFKKTIKKKIYPVSCLKKEGLKELIDGLAERL